MGKEKAKEIGHKMAHGTAWHRIYLLKILYVHSWPEYITCNIKLDKELRTGKDIELDRTHNLRDGMGLKIAQDK
jgi:hypothetical protein